MARAAAKAPEEFKKITPQKGVVKLTDIVKASGIKDKAAIEKLKQLVIMKLKDRGYSDAGVQKLVKEGNTK